MTTGLGGGSAVIGDGDWADKLAATIMQDIIEYHDPPKLIAARLRVIRNEGELIGIEQARKVVLAPADGNSGEASS